ncbi:cytochrome P450 [Aspergillus mulundensis]|uniref:Cytochrome P450 n=1 Tax=Aspergillus mulundensis TaxID=1810919 RepID=A0A3D8T5G5_9EURO|nr:hypothetical protein DSM5745_01115 [Aspergillus mulundensis]RDW93793.1 hypothetical protein DSM5745_01115 [Aspergillus mulundensis]
MLTSAATIKPVIQTRTEEILTREIGAPEHWKRLNVKVVSAAIGKHVSGGVLFGEALADNPAFLRAMYSYVSKISAGSLAVRYFNVGSFRNIFMYLLHWTYRHDLATATRYITELMAERRRQNLPEDEKPVDCIQWAMDQNLPNDQKKPEDIAHRILHVSAAGVETPITSTMNLLFDIASHSECIDELRAEIIVCLAEEGGRWTQNAMAKMLKLESFIQESFRMNPVPLELTGWRVVIADSFRFDESLVFPKGTLLTFPSKFFQNDPDVHPDADKFDHLRFYKYRKQETGLNGAPASSSRDLRTEWLGFGYGRQACPGRIYSIAMLKTIIGEIILRYDVRYAGGPRPRPSSIDVNPAVWPDPSIDLEFRTRG